MSGRLKKSALTSLGASTEVKQTATISTAISSALKHDVSVVRDRAGKLDAIQDNVQDLVLLLVRQIATALREKTKLAALVSQIVSALSTTLSQLLDLGRTPAVLEGLDHASPQLVKRVVTTITHALGGLNKTPTTGTVDQTVVTAATANAKEAPNCLRLLLMRVCEERMTITTYFAQLVASLHLWARNARSVFLILQICATATAGMAAVAELISLAETYAFTAELIATGGAGGPDGSRRGRSATAPADSGGAARSSTSGGADGGDELAAVSVLGDDDVNVWDEPEETVSKAAEFSERPGTLNQLVTRLTHHTAYDTKYMKTFITTYRSFTDARTLWEKLMQRYRVPAGRGDLSHNIRLRICVVLKHWIEVQFADMDDKLIADVTEFVTDRLQKDGRGNTGDQIFKELKKQQKKHEGRADALHVPRSINVPDVTQEPTEMFLHFPASAIAEQLTLIDTTIFKKIEPSELLNQAWNKKKYKYRAPHVLEMISRANAISYWVASLLLWNASKAKRAQLYTRFCDVIEKLLDMNSYNCTMAVLAGLNMSSVHRLKHTVALVSDAHMAVKQRAETLLQPQQSFKNYRAAMHNRSGDCVPYLGVYLTDLTFIEDGNPDTVQPESSNGGGGGGGAVGSRSGSGGTLKGAAARATMKAKPATDAVDEKLERTQQRVAKAFGKKPAKVDPAASRKLMELLAKRDYEGARKKLHEMVHKCPHDHLLLYQLCTVETKLGNYKEALDALSRALSNGFTNFSHLERDPDLRALRARPQYARLVADAQRRHQRLADDPAARAARQTKTLINFKKRALVYTVISEIQLYQQAHYPIVRVEPLHTFLRELPHDDEEQLYQLSLMREPRGADAATIQ